MSARRIQVRTVPALLAVSSTEARAMLGNMSLRSFRRAVARRQIRPLGYNRYSAEQIQAFVKKQSI